MECMTNNVSENQENGENLYLPSINIFYEVFPGSIVSSEEVDLYLPSDSVFDEVIYATNKEKYEDNKNKNQYQYQYPLLDGSDFCTPQCITEFFYTYPLCAKQFLPDDMFHELFCERVSLSESQSQLEDNGNSNTTNLEAENDPSTNVAPKNNTWLEEMMNKWDDMKLE
ncbi:hypothetical protein PIB30_074789 [Stylosanthes scabra]|uniref:Uncharacterized protein n=1 Tax=Stylosanthes scabra TaxID=79078 RepID=A0ABU6ZNE0_9FABA|nr:hypothetical protein [Stylosanthes scabra]